MKLKFPVSDDQSESHHRHLLSTHVQYTGEIHLTVA